MKSTSEDLRAATTSASRADAGRTWSHSSSALDRMFSPRTIALVGATEKSGSVGGAVLSNLLRGSFPGEIYPINPKHASLSGRPSYADISKVPKPIDLAVIVTPANTVPGLIQQCADAGVKAVVIISSGFKECGAEGTELEKRILAIAQPAQMRILGPNCLGAMIPHLGLNATFASALAHPGSVAFLSQSGALCTAVLDWSLRENVGFSAFVSIGSMLDVGWGDLITHFGDDPHTKSIVCYMESVGDARSFLSAAREIARTKPIIVIKVGCTDAAAKAAASHTGSLTGSDAVLDAAFRRVGVLRVNAIEELFDMAEVLGKQPRPRGPRLSMITNAGGPGALATDALILAGGQLSELSSETRAHLDQILPAHWSHGNPIDVLGDADADRYRRTLKLALEDPGSDGALVILTPQAMTNAAATADALREVAAGSDKPVLASWMGGPSVDSGETILNRAGIPTFKYPDRAARAFAYMWRYSENLRSLYETPTSEAKSPKREETARLLIERVRHEGRTLLTEIESKDVLHAYGIPTVETYLARTESEAVDLARQLGFPVAVKLHSETITHKSDVGGVELDLRGSDAVRQAWRRIAGKIAERAGAAHFLGCTVQRMARGAGFELILGSSIDPQFGPVILFGTGGKLVEIFKDRSLGLPPLNATLARRLMERSRIYAALKGVRGEKAVDLAALERLLVRFSELVIEQRWIAEIDINPLLVSSEQILALDARIVLHSRELSETQLPRLAIRPYPSRYVLPWKLKNGTHTVIRPIRPEDEPLMIKFHQSLSEQSVYRRYFTALKLDERIAHERLSRLCFIDYDREMALVAEHHDPASPGAEILGVGRLTKLHAAREAEFGLLIADRWQHQGLGSQLLKMLVQIGRDESLSRISATILPDNREMQCLARKAGFSITHPGGAQECQAELQLGDARPRRSQQMT